MDFNYDVLEFSTLSKDKKDDINLILEMLNNATTINEKVEFTKVIFRMMSPTADVSMLLSSTKDFNTLGKNVEDAEKGLHAMRAYIAHHMYWLRRSHYGYKSEAGKIFDNTGMVQINDFLPNELVGIIENAIKKFPLAVHKNDANIIANLNPMEFGHLRNMIINTDFGNPYGVSDLSNVVSDCIALKDHPGTEGRKMYLQNTFVQRLHNKKGDGDVQKVLHQDTFFPALKFWYFPQAVTAESGPLSYALGSHLLTRTRLQYIYEESIRIAKGESTEYSKDHSEGSIRISPEKLHELGYKETPALVPANTLVIANVFGFHRRSEVEVEGFRDAVHGSIRVSNPFSVI